MEGTVTYYDNENHEGVRRRVAKCTSYEEQKG